MSVKMIRTPGILFGFKLKSVFEVKHLKEKIGFKNQFFFEPFEDLSTSTEIDRLNKLRLLQNKSTKFTTESYLYKKIK